MPQFKIHSKISLSTEFLSADFVAIPDYGSGATEHWGLITYREARLLFTEGVSSEGNREGIANIVAHECVHLVSLLSSLSPYHSYQVVINVNHKL